jgi:23S rRNA pseudouridine2605 synthase
VAQERLQKYLAAAGVASRRKAEALITAGRVKVNERVVKELGSRVDPARDLVTVDGSLVSPPQAKSYYLLYKPSGCVTTAADPEGRPTALQYLAGVRARVFPVGRLDYDAEGAVLLTDDGELANRLAHPRYGHQRVYLVKVRGEPEAAALERMVAGVRLEDGPARALEAGVHERAERNVWIRVVVGEGRHHLVKRLCEAVGLSVQRLFRPEFGGVTVEGLRAGEFRPLAPAEVRSMQRRVGLGAGEGPQPPPRSLPRAARRHGHGPPPIPGTTDLAAPGATPRAAPGATPAAGDRSSPNRARTRPHPRNQGGSARTRVSPDAIPAKKSWKK